MHWSGKANSINGWKKRCRRQTRVKRLTRKDSKLSNDRALINSTNIPISQYPNISISQYPNISISQYLNIPVFVFRTTSLTPVGKAGGSNYCKDFVNFFHQISGFRSLP